MSRWLIGALGLAGLIALWIAWGILVPDRVPVRVVELERGLVESTVTHTKAGTVRARAMPSCTHPASTITSPMWSGSPRA